MELNESMSMLILILHYYDTLILHSFSSSPTPKSSKQLISILESKR